ncbi:hypothetical protein EST38_g13719 [Candolleomyces aberdarensis]|uniref:Uncharacterized protein n=1 Tax=Candolleomyces aberdarensis TaxID=2316362 RepID=A0A4Q2CZ93_9AGAR|nr:hypothetical protein EST38_g13719 [Candolleomyces aberdarensis]
MRRVGYDADSRQYTFLDRKGTLYQSDPGNRYGHLTPMGDPTARAEKERPMMFEGNAPTNKSSETTTKPLTFQDFVPAELITSPKYGPDEKPPPTPKSSKKSPSSRTSQEKEKRRSHSRHASTASAASSSSPKRHVEFTEEPVGVTSPKERFRDAVKSSGIPKMQGVVQSLRRSVTSVTKKSFGSGSKGRERSKSEVKDTKAAAEYVQLSDS